jgi:hypothetical protein
VANEMNPQVEFISLEQAEEADVMVCTCWGCAPAVIRPQ